MLCLTCNQIKKNIEKQNEIEQKCNVKLIFYNNIVEIISSNISMISESCIEHAFTIINELAK
jgi:hypothetical protein